MNQWVPVPLGDFQSSHPVFVSLPGTVWGDAAKGMWGKGVGIWDILTLILVHHPALILCHVRYYPSALCCVLHPLELTVPLYHPHSTQPQFYTLWFCHDHMMVAGFSRVMVQGEFVSHDL